MEDPSLHWEMEEEYYPSEESSGKVSWILNKGLVFGKKILMTGILITSVPFVLPPLVAMSVFGVAASVPSGLFLASYACSEKVMSSLLPGSSPPSPFLLGNEDVPKTNQVEEQDHLGFGQDIDIEKEKEQEQIDDPKGRVEMRIELPVMHASETVKEKGCDDKNELGTMSGDPKSDSTADELQEIVVKIETDHERDNDDEFGQNEILIEVKDVTVMESGGHESIEEEKLTRETTGLIEKFSNENVDEGKQTIIHETAEDMEAKSAGRKGKRKGKKKGKINESRDQELPKQNEEIKNDSAKTDSEAVVQVEATPETHEGKVHTGGNVVNGGTKAPRKIHHSGRLTEQKTTGLKGVSSPSKNEGLDSEENIRKQIASMKAIVGYKGTPKPHASCLDELKALYFFTGVEPPESFKNPSDIEELSHKLKFLMSIVGVK